MVYYLSGDAPDYTGLIVTTAVQLIDELEFALVTAGWTAISKTAGSNLFIKGTTSNGHSCWVEFAISGTSPDLTITLRGWLEEAKTNGSPAATHTLSFRENADNRLWLTADNDAGCICIYNPSSGASSGYHFGFLQRIDTTDPWAWMIGRIHASGPVYAYSAKGKHANTIWKRLSTDFAGTPDPIGTQVSEQFSAIPITTLDFVKRMAPHGWNANVNFNATDSRNPAYLAYNGGRNYNGQAVIDPYGYLEGRNATNVYGSSGNNTLYFRGFVKFVYCGVAIESACAQCVDPLTGNRILSVGGNQWQGMRIK